ncbi:V-type proton ATPase 116 kDa subunit a 1-like [Gordionus sp. m RMFG-2023]|uniref:V-type proton ATPase 116 kDa subunit a 1-like n=1 Tax=Gordionus sp. m RMFG-2023 TaxID=3053472 RepID=UPI0031FCEBF7
MIYHTMNHFKSGEGNMGKFMVGEGWCSLKTIDKVTSVLAIPKENDYSNCHMVHRMTIDENMAKKIRYTPPTYIINNEYTSIFQSIVNAYGPPKYLELNPAPYLIITFPFLFAIMFGDAGHGLIVALLAFCVIFFDNSYPVNFLKKDEAVRMFYEGRYLILLMGLFSIYTGAVYNDYFSKSISFSGSKWLIFNKDFEKSMNVPTRKITHKYDPHREFAIVVLDPVVTYENVSDFKDSRKIRSPYMYSMDPIWKVAKNEISFNNSYKMKLSIIFGIMHMTLGLFLGLCNHIYFNEKIDIYCSFLPRLIFLISTFGYLAILIVVKWVKVLTVDSKCAPSLLHNLIHMYLFSEVKGVCGDFLFDRQKTLQVVLVFVAVLCIPWLLFSKPFILYLNGYKGSELSECMLHQAISTIEYCLECLSHTASYLRLWALSLAHSELSKVLWNMILRMGFSCPHGPLFCGIKMYFMFSIWAILTFSILILMEGLSAFLHALRLHWVEFQRKFYDGGGRLFEPLSFANVHYPIKRE